MSTSEETKTKIENLERNYGNHVAIVPFNGALEDCELLYLAEYLVRIAHTPNLRVLEKRGWRKHFT